MPRSSPKRFSAAWARLLAGGMLESLLLRCLGKGARFSCSDGVKAALCILSQAPVSKFLHPKSARNEVRCLKIYMFKNTCVSIFPALAAGVSEDAGCARYGEMR